MSFSRAHGIVRHEPKGRLHRIAYSEHLEDKKLLRAADRLLNDGARSQQRWEMFEANWQRFRAAFATEYPAVDQIEEKLSMACAAQEVGQEKFLTSPILKTTESWLLVLQQL
jgi:hypothetical protein